LAGVGLAADLEAGCWAIAKVVRSSKAIILFMKYLLDSQ
jgi:hypothetical protein